MFSATLLFNSNFFKFFTTLRAEIFAGRNFCGRNFRGIYFRDLTPESLSSAKFTRTCSIAKTSSAKSDNFRSIAKICSAKLRDFFFTFRNFSF